ncbi:MAG: hypothetical protein LQ340_000172 [Diploschistes diacapsis]|nr:MAG: hypothetical protein LQ340_000172 [Diploschistes diacapsis]
MSITDPAHMPPKCCTEDCIPLKYVDKLFDTKFKVKWNRRYQEYTTKNRIYCPAKKCGTWIPPNDIKVDTTGGANGGRKYGTCPRCKTQVCATCNGKRHKSRECPKDESTTRLAEMAKDNGWQRCYNCSATIELKEGCNHMTCRCTAEFCMICGSKWKSCDCPWFNYATVEADRLDHMNIPQVREAVANGNPAINQPRAYQEELERRREQEQRDEELARRMQRLDFVLNNRANRLGTWGVGTGAGHFLNDDFVQRATGILTGAYNPEQRTAADRLVAESRNQQRVNASATGMEIPVPNPPVAVLNPARDTAAQPSPPPLRTDVRRSATVHRAVAPSRRSVQDLAQEDPFTDTAARDGAPTSEAQRRSAVLAGLTRGSTNGRVDAWRRYVSGNDGSVEVVF